MAQGYVTVSSDLFGDPQSGTWQEFVLGSRVPGFLFKESRDLTLQWKSWRLLQNVGQGRWNWGCLGGGLATAIAYKGQEAENQERRKKSRKFIQGDFVEDQIWHIFRTCIKNAKQPSLLRTIFEIAIKSPWQKLSQVQHVISHCQEG